jgi:hypothetical protein
VASALRTSSSTSADNTVRVITSCTPTWSAFRFVPAKARQMSREEIESTAVVEHVALGSALGRHGTSRE